MLFVNRLTGKIDEVPLSIVKPIVKEATFTLAATDADSEKCLRCNSATDMDCIIPPNIDVAFPVGVVIPVQQMGEGVIEAVAGVGVTINSTAKKTGGTGMLFLLWQVAANEWNVIGGVE